MGIERKTSGLIFRAVLGCSLIYFLLIVFALVYYNLHLISDDLRHSITIQAYLEKSVQNADVQKIESEMWRIPGVSEVRFINKEEALSVLKEAFGEKVFEGLKSNPLPASFEIKLDRNHLGWENIHRAAEYIKRISGVKEVDYGGDLLKKIDKIVRVGTLVGVVLLALISLAVVAVVINASQLLYYKDSFKLGIMEMLGATDFYLSGPLIIKGALIGGVSSIIAIILSIGSFMGLGKSISDVEFLPPQILILLVVWGVIWGAFGGYSGFRSGKRSGFHIESKHD